MNLFGTSPMQLTLTVSVSNSAPIGPRTVTVTNPDGGMGSSNTVFSVASGP